MLLLQLGTQELIVLLVALIIITNEAAGHSASQAEAGLRPSSKRNREDEEESRNFIFCNCPFDCLYEKGIAFHKVVLTEYDLGRLPDLLPASVRNALQEKCYSLLTGDDLDLYPDLVSRKSRGHEVTEVPPAVASSNVDRIEDIVIPVLSFMSLFLVIIVVLCQRHLQQPRLDSSRSLASATNPRIVISIPSVADLGGDLGHPHGCDSPMIKAPDSVSPYYGMDWTEEETDVSTVCSEETVRHKILTLTSSRIN